MSVGSSSSSVSSAGGIWSKPVNSGVLSTQFKSLHLIVLGARELQHGKDGKTLIRSCPKIILADRSIVGAPVRGNAGTYNQKFVMPYHGASTIRLATVGSSKGRVHGYKDVSLEEINRTGEAVTTTLNVSERR